MMKDQGEQTNFMSFGKEQFSSSNQHYDKSTLKIQDSGYPKVPESLSSNLTHEVYQNIFKPQAGSMGKLMSQDTGSSHEKMTVTMPDVNDNSMNSSHLDRRVTTLQDESNRIIESRMFNLPRRDSDLEVIADDVLGYKDDGEQHVYDLKTTAMFMKRNRSLDNNLIENEFQTIERRSSQATHEDMPPLYNPNRRTVSIKRSSLGEASDVSYNTGKKNKKGLSKSRSRERKRARVKSTE